MKMKMKKKKKKKLKRAFSAQLPPDGYSSIGRRIIAVENPKGTLGTISIACASVSLVIAMLHV